MRYEARITAYDVLDSVHVAVVVFEAEDIPQVSTRVVVRSVSTQRGTGESDPRQWTIDDLVQALENL